MHTREGITQYQAYQALCQGMQEHIGRQGMVWHCFANQAKAEALLSWLKQQANLSSFGIDKANIKKEFLKQDEKGLAEQWFVVRLTDEQRQAILNSAASCEQSVIAASPVINPIQQWTVEDKALFEVNNENETGLLLAALEKKPR